MNILFVTSEAYPLIKTGGLADVSGSLPKAIAQLGQQVRLLLPAYQAVLEKYQNYSVLANFTVGGAGRLLHARVLTVEVPEVGTEIWLLDIPELFQRPGNPYLAPDGQDWWDNGERFAVFSRAAAEIAMNRVGLGWRADVVHANDWQTGFLPAFLSEEAQPPKTLFTIHNMAYAGYFPKSLFDSMWLPWHWWTEQGVEFYGQISMLKAGIMYADWVTTVSPTYAREICTAEFAYGFDGIMQQRHAEGRLVGILNGIDTKQWNPQYDPYIEANYSVHTGMIGQKQRNKEALLKLFQPQFRLAQLKRPLIGFVGRLVTQKGVDLITEVIPQLVSQHDVSFVMVGAGDPRYELELRELAQRYPENVFIHIGYSEALAHQVEAGADMFLMPSRFEPCGLNQMYSLTYGTPPIVHYTGGLVDTVVNASDENMANQTATGFVCYEPNVPALKATIEHALYLYTQQDSWRQLQHSGMTQVFNWQNSARKYLDLYTKEI